MRSMPGAATCVTADSTSRVLVVCEVNNSRIFYL
jgi:hypothetical protein